MFKLVGKMVTSTGTKVTKYVDTNAKGVVKHIVYPEGSRMAQKGINEISSIIKNGDVRFMSVRGPHKKSFFFGKRLGSGKTVIQEFKDYLTALKMCKR